MNRQMQQKQKQKKKIDLRFKEADHQKRFFYKHRRKNFIIEIS